MSNADLVRAGYEGFARGDLQAVIDLLDENAEWHEAEHVPYWSGGPYVGPQNILENAVAFTRIPHLFEDFKVDVRRIVDAGDTVLVEARYRSPNAYGTGRPLDAQVVHVWDFRDGKVIRWQQYVDTWQMVEVTGVTPAPAET